MSPKNKNSNMTMFLFLLFLFLFVVLLYFSCNMGKKERYVDTFTPDNKNLNTFSRGAFNSNLDPNNPNLRFDPNVYGGFVKGNPTAPENLAVQNMSRENFQPSEQQVLKQALENSQPANIKLLETFSSEPSKENLAINDAASYIPKYQTKDYAKMATMENQEGQKKFSEQKAPQQNTLEYTIPTELLPVPDMAQPLMRDPSDPSNFMYSRTIFAPLKSRNHNTPDRIRGDLDIKPLKTGWFDSASIPSVDLAKGYFAYFTDIEQYTDLQDVAYNRDRERNVNSFESKAKEGGSTPITQLKAAQMVQDVMKPNLAYAGPSEVNMPTLKQSPFGNVEFAM